MPEVPTAYGDHIVMAGPLTQSAFGVAADELPKWVCEAASRHFSSPAGSTPRVNAVVLVYDGYNDQKVHAVVPGELVEEGFRASECTTLESYRANDQLGLFPDGHAVTIALTESGVIPDEAAREFEALEGNIAIQLPIGTTWGDAGEVDDRWNLSPDDTAAPDESEEIKPPFHEQASIDESAEHSAQRIDHVLVNLLKSNDGVFLGERHDQPNVRQMVTHLMPRLKAEGVTTISFELQHSKIQTLLQCKDRDEALLAIPTLDVEQLYDMVKAAQQHGVSVIGHEEPTAVTIETDRVGGAAWVSETRSGREHLDDYRDYLNSAITLDGLAHRDEWAASFIRKNAAPGKIIVIGGANHSTHSGIDAENRYLGLNKHLGIPSIDTGYSSAAIDKMDAIPVGSAVSNAGSGADFYMNLPPDLFKHMRWHVRPGYYDGRSWPPPSAEEMKAVSSAEYPANSLEDQLAHALGGKGAQDVFGPDGLEALKAATAKVTGVTDVKIDPNSGNHAQDQSSAGVSNGQASQNSVKSR